MYDLLAGTKMLHASRYLSYRESLRQFPTLSKEKLKATVRGFIPLCCNMDWIDFVNPIHVAT